MQIFFTKYLLHHPRLVDSADAALQMKANCTNLCLGFFFTELRVGTPTVALFKNQV